jgi:hypothetical protein
VAIDNIPTFVLLTLASLGIAYLVGERTRTLLPTVVGFGVHWAAAVGAFVAIGLVVPDANLYDQIAMGGHPDEPLPLGKEGWTALLTFIYKLFGHQPVLGLLINVLAAALTVGFMAMVARTLGLPARRTAWFVALSPPGILWSSLLLRESLTWMFLAITLLGFAGLAASRRVPWSILVLVVGFVGLFEFRGTAAVIIGAAGAIAVPLIRRNYLLLVGGAAAVALIVLSPLGAPIQNIFEQYNLDRIEYSREWMSENATTGFPVGDLWQVLVRVAIGPGPWEWATVGPLFAVDGILWIAVLLLAARGWATTPHRRLTLVLLLPAVLFWFSLAVTSGNYGTMQRLRALPELVLLPLAAAGTLARAPGAIEEPWELRPRGETVPAPRGARVT